MASTYVNDLRLEEIATGEQSGTWGDTTNTNLELIAEAFSFGTEAITTNADTHTTTIADGATDPGRSMFLKYTGTLDSACTITIAPNTVSKLWFIENATSGSQNILISQGSGANITIPPGDTKAIYSDGAGSGAAMVDAFASLSVVDLKVQDDLTVTDDMTVGGTLGVTGVLTTTATQVATGGITSGSNIVSDTDSTDDLGTTGTRWANLFVDGITATDQITATGFTGTLDGILGSGSAAAATVTTLDTSGAVNLNLTTDSTSSTSGALIVDGGVGIAKKLFVGTDLDVTRHLDVDGTTNLDVVDIDGAVNMATTALVTGVLTTTAATVSNGGGQFNGAINVGVDDTGYDVKFFGATASAYMQWDASADDLILGGAARLIIGDTDPNARLLRVKGTGDLVELVSTNTGAGGAQLDLKHESASPANDDIVGIINFNGLDAGANSTQYANIQGVATDISNEIGELRFGTRTSSSSFTAKMVIDGNGKVLIGTDTPRTTFYDSNFGAQVQIEGLATTSNYLGMSIVTNSNDANGGFLALGSTRGTAVNATTVLQAGDALGALTFQGSDGSNMISGADIFAEVLSGVGANDMPTKLNFRTNSGTTAPVERMRVQHTSGNNVVIADGLTLTDGNVIIGGAGHGIDFSAQTTAGGTVQEILNHYEQGVFTPTLIDSGGEEVNAYVNQAGFYVRVGARVTCHGYIRANGLASASGNMLLGGFPFDAVNVTNGHASMDVGYGTGLNITAGQNMGGYLGPNTTQATVLIWNAATGTANMTFSDLSSNGGFMFAVSYNAV